MPAVQCDDESKRAQRTRGLSHITRFNRPKLQGDAKGNDRKENFDGSSATRSDGDQPCGELLAAYCLLLVCCYACLWKDSVDIVVVTFHLLLFVAHAVFVDYQCLDLFCDLCFHLEIDYEKITIRWNDGSATD